MTIKYGDWLGESTLTVGSGNITFGGALLGYASFAPLGDCQIYYTIVDGQNKETGVGNITGREMTRTPVSVMINDQFVGNAAPIPLTGNAQVYGVINSEFFKNVTMNTDPLIANLEQTLDSKYSDDNKPTPADIGADAAGTATTKVTEHEQALNVHQMSSIVGLVSALNGKANTTHSHVMTDITNLAAEFNKKVDKASPVVDASIVMNGAGSNTRGMTLKNGSLIVMDVYRLIDGSFNLIMNTNAGVYQNSFKFLLNGGITQTAAQGNEAGVLARRDYVDNTMMPKSGGTFTGATSSPFTYNFQNAGAQTIGLQWFSGADFNTIVGEFKRVPGNGDFELRTYTNSGTAPVLFRFRLDGAAVNLGGGPWLSYSDIRKKNVFGEFEIGLEAIRKIMPKYFELKSNPGKQFVGVIAQDIETTPLAGDTLTKDSEGYFIYDGNATTYAMINAIKELDAMLQAALAEIAMLKAK